MSNPSTTPETDFETSKLGMKLRQLHHAIKAAAALPPSAEAEAAWNLAMTELCELQVKMVFAKVTHLNPELKAVLSNA